MGIGCAAVNFDSLFLCLSSVFIYGIGIGLTIPSINLLVIELDFQRSSSALNIVNFFWGVGAILNVLSVLSWTHPPTSGAYSAAKAAG